MRASPHATGGNRGDPADLSRPRAQTAVSDYNHGSVSDSSRPGHSVACGRPLAAMNFPFRWALPAMNRILLCSPLFALLLIPGVSDAQFEGMKYRIPLDANTLVLINAEKMFGSKVADRDRWEARRKAAYESGVSALPPDATSVLLAARTDLEFGKSVWELALVKLSGERNVTTVAARFGGTMDEIVGRSAARLPDDHYVVQIMKDLMGSYTPANRQDVSRWLRSTDVGSAQSLPPYLEQAFGYATKVGTPIVMAMDVNGLISEAGVKQRIKSFEALSGVDIGSDKLAKLISGAQGITLGITLEDETVAAIRVDFSESPAMLKGVGKSLLIEVLQRQGVMIDDIHQWTPSVVGNTFMLRGTLSTDGTRRVLSVLELPHTLADAMGVATSPGSDQEGAKKLLAAQQYYKSVTTLLDDLRGKGKRDHVKTFGQAAIWYGKYARKIDRYPILGVDEELLDYGAQMSGLLRDAEMAMKGVGMRTSLRTAGNNPSSGGYSSYGGGYRAATGYDGGLYGPQGYTASIGAGRASLIEKGRSDAVIRGQERTSGANTVQQIWLAIDEATSAMRRALTNKYSADF